MKFKLILCVVITSGMLCGSQPPADMQQSSASWMSWVAESIRSAAARLMATLSNRSSFSASEKQVTAQDYDEAKNEYWSGIKKLIDLYTSGAVNKSDAVAGVAKEIRRIVDDLAYPTPSTKIHVLLKKNVLVPRGVEDTNEIISEACKQISKEVMKAKNVAGPEVLAKNKKIDVAIAGYKKEYASSTDVYNDILATVTPEGRALASIASRNEPHEAEYDYLVCVVKNALKDAFDYAVAYPTSSTRLDALLKRSWAGIDIFTQARTELIQEEKEIQLAEEQARDKQIDVKIRELDSRLAQSEDTYKGALALLSVDDRARIAVALEADCVECQKKINPEIFEKTNFYR